MAIGKRKRIDTELLDKKTAPPVLNLDTFATLLKADPNKRSLLDLPAELRVNIYEYVFASTGGVHLARQTYKRALATTSKLVYANKQIRYEFMAAATLYSDISTTVLRLNFTHIVHFLNRSTDEELKALPSRAEAAPSTRTLTVVLQADGDFNGSRDWLLDRWLNRIEHPTKKGTSVAFSYCVDANVSRSLDDPYRQHLDPFYGTLIRCEPRAHWRSRRGKAREPECRREVELEKIIKALKRESVGG